MKWINIKESRPPYDEPVLITDGETINLAILYNEWKWKDWPKVEEKIYYEAWETYGVHGYDDYNLDINDDEITHWMRLPGLP